MSYPEQFGQPCWTKEKVDKCISLPALLKYKKNMRISF